MKDYIAVRHDFVQISNEKSLQRFDLDDHDKKSHCHERVIESVRLGLMIIFSATVIIFVVAITKYF